MRATVTERGGRTTSGELLYSYTYPHAITDKHGNVERFERRPQRCAGDFPCSADGRTSPARRSAATAREPDVKILGMIAYLMALLIGGTVHAASLGISWWGWA